MSQFHRRNVDHDLTMGSAREALRLIRIPVSTSVGKDITNVPDTNKVESLPAIDFFDHLEIFPGSKIAHFKQLHKITGIPYSEMVRVLPYRTALLAPDLANSFSLMTN